MNPFINTAIKAARDAANIIMRGYRRLDLVKVHRKGVKDFVTDIDKASEESIIQTLSTAYPDHSFLSEECGTLGTNDYQWIIDPLDGTINFMRGLPHFSISIALSIRGRIEHGLIYDPVRDDLFTASRGEGAQRNNYRLRVSGRYHLSDCLFGTSCSTQVDSKLFEQYYASLQKIAQEAMSFRRMGSAALNLAYTAAGTLDGYWGFGLKPWDLAAGTLMIREAGGLITDIHGGENFLKSGELIAANPKLFKLLFKTLKPFYQD